MNERIKTLARHCGLPTDQDRMLTYEVEKFAESIVKECIKEIGYKSAELLDIDMYPHYQERLKKRFGVN